MSVCTFFGHRDYTGIYNCELEKTVERLINDYNTDLFICGNTGAFDLNVAIILKKLRTIYPHIKCFIVLSKITDQKYDLETLLPDGIENVPPRFAIDYRNKWMIEKSDYVVACVNRSFGGASKFTELATKKNRKVFNIG